MCSMLDDHAAWSDALCSSPSGTSRKRARDELARRLEAGGHERILGHGGEAIAQNSDSWRTSFAGAGAAARVR